MDKQILFSLQTPFHSINSLKLYFAIKRPSDFLMGAYDFELFLTNLSIAE